MRAPFSSNHSILAVFTLSSAIFAACGSDPSLSDGGGDGDLGGDGDGDSSLAGAGNGDGDGDIDLGGDGDGDGDGDGAGVLSVTPEDAQTITIDIGDTSSEVEFLAFYDGQDAEAAWSVDRGDIGTVTRGPSHQGVFTPSGLVGGTVVVTAALNDRMVTREVVVELVGTQNGADPDNPKQATQIPEDVDALTAGGGPGGVGGDGLGTAVTDEDLIDALSDPTDAGAAIELALVYPYDGTVFPRGILAPLVAWDSTEGDADAIQMRLRTESGSFDWTGTFGPPVILQDTGAPFVHHPIPQDVWEAATNSAEGNADRLQFSLTVASGGEAYGPLEQTWTIASARLSGTIYYNSYGTNLAKNFNGAQGGDGSFGGATLGIRVGDTGPSLVAGESGDSSYCRVCHSVAADGSRLISSNQDDSFTYDLGGDGSITETQAGAILEFPGVYPDGSLALSSSGQLYELPAADAPLPITGLDDVATEIGTPMFSANGARVAFNPMAGPIENPTQKIVVMEFDSETFTFSDAVEVVDYTGEPAGVRPGWPAFFPDGSSIVFHAQSDPGVTDSGVGDLRTRREALAQIHWASANSSADVTPLNRLNGMDEDGNSYLAPLRSPIDLECRADGHQVGDVFTSHENDVNHNYEPTVNPVGGGGYAWVVFTSRRRYGNVATIPPFCSDPRGVDLIENITPKKLWVAAVDLDAAPGEDKSHPAFYLPGQELLAGNSRAFWVLDPCREDGDSCESGDQCCGGFCQPNGEDGALVCSNEPPEHSCSQLQERCEEASDCCDSTHTCLGGFCAVPVPR